MAPTGDAYMDMSGNNQDAYLTVDANKDVGKKSRGAPPPAMKGDGAFDIAGTSSAYVDIATNMDGGTSSAYVDIAANVTQPNRYEDMSGVVSPSKKSRAGPLPVKKGTSPGQSNNYVDITPSTAVFGGDAFYQAPTLAQSLYQEPGQEMYADIQQEEEEKKKREKVEEKDKKKKKK